MANDKLGESAVGERGNGGQHLGLEWQCATDLTGPRFPIVVRVVDMPDDLGTLLDMGFDDNSANFLNACWSLLAEGNSIKVEATCKGIRDELRRPYGNDSLTGANGLTRYENRVRDFAWLSRFMNDVSGGSQA